MCDWQTDGCKDEQAQCNIPNWLFKVGGIKRKKTFYVIENKNLKDSFLDQGKEDIKPWKKHLKLQLLY